MEGTYMGELQPFHGKWNWPLREMLPGYYFTVDHAVRPPEAVRNYVSVAGARMGKFFSVTANDPEHAGHCRVTCTLPPMQRDQGGGDIVMDYEKLHPKMSEWYGVALNDVVLWDNLYSKKVGFVKARQHRKPPCKRMIVRTVLDHGWFGLVFHPDGFEFHPLEAGTALEAWKTEPDLGEVMQ